MTLDLPLVVILGLMGSYHEIPHALEFPPSANYTSFPILGQLGVTYVLGIITTSIFSPTLDSPPTSVPSLAIFTPRELQLMSFLHDEILSILDGR